jgi:hypothetical protein
VTFIPRDVWANAQAQGSADLDHERDTILAIYAAIPISLETPIVTSNRLAGAASWP